MRLLLDTHAALWSLDEVKQLSPAANAHLRDPGNDVYLSVASVWEMAIKRATGKLKVPDDVRSRLIGQGFVELPITGEHAWAAGKLPSLHSDPFDRMIVAQAAAEDLVLVTADQRLAAYGVATLW